MSTVGPCAAHVESTPIGRCSSRKAHGRVRVLHIQKATGVAGSERHLLSLLPGLAARGVEVRMCVLTAGEASRFVDALRAEGVDVVTVAAGPDVNPLLWPRLARQMRAFRADLVHTHLVHADLWGLTAAKIARVPAVSTTHDVAPFYRARVMGFAGRVAARGAAHRIAISHHVAAYLTELQLADPNELSVVHYGIDAGAWPMSADEVAEARTGYGLGPNDVAIGVASRLVPGKGHATLIAAVDRLVAGGRHDVRLLVAGDGPLMADLARRADKLSQAGAVRFLGFVRDIRLFMNACDVMTFPTGAGVGEGFGLAALEAMATGRPVIASRLGPLPEVVDATSGLLVVPDSVDELAHAIASLADDANLRRSLGAGAARRAREAFGLDRMIDETVAVYRRVLDRGTA